MGQLTKIFINTEFDIQFADISIQNYINMTRFRGFIMVNASNNIITNYNKKFIHQIFNGSNVFISAQSFQQNNMFLGNQVRKYTTELIMEFKKITCIGGESYLYGLTCVIPIIYAYTNSTSIFNDINYNEKFYKSKVKSELCDYNKINKIEPSEICLINLSSLNINLMKVINKTKFNHVIIISCHHEDFWKKISYLSNYKIKSRKQFISQLLGYFLTVTVLQWGL